MRCRRCIDYRREVVILRRLITGMVLVAMVVLLVCSRQAAQFVQEGLHLCAASLIPSLFPFFVLSSFFAEFCASEITNSRLFHGIGRIFGCSATGAGVFFLSLLGGYPVGPRLIAQLQHTSHLSRQESEHLLLFCNNAGPAFFLGLVGLGQFQSLRTGVFLYLIHALSSTLVAIIFRPKVPFFSISAPKATNSFPKTFVNSVARAGGVMVQLCAFVTFFYTALRLFSSLTGVDHPLFLGFFELTQGILSLSSTFKGICMASGLCGWGGLSVHFQTAYVLAETGISTKNHLRGKILQSFLATFLTFLAFFLL